MRQEAPKCWCSGAVAVGEPAEVIADVGWPVGDQSDESPSIVCKQCARSFLEMGEVAGQGGHEVIGRISCQAFAVPVSTCAPRFLDELAERNGSAAGLRVEPFPVAWQQRYFARHHAELRPATAARLAWPFGPLACRRRDLRQSLQHLAFAAAQVEVDRASRAVAEDQDRLACTRILALDRQRYLRNRTGGQTTLA